MDFADGSTVGGTAPGQVPAVPDLPPPFPAVGAGRHAGPGLAGLGRGSAGARAIGLGRDLHRRLVQRGQKGGRAVGPTRRGKGTKIMAIADRHGLPVAVGVASASPHETRLVEPTVEQRFTAATPGCMIGDRAYDSDPLDARLQQQYGHRTHRAAQVEPQSAPNPKTDAICDATVDAGKLNACLLGCITFIVWSPVGSTTRPTSSVWSSSDASSSS